MANVIIVGCGRVGSQLANMLSSNDRNVCVVDIQAEAFANLGRSFNGATLQGLGYDEDVLIRAGIEDCDTVAAVTSSDNTNLMVVEVARRIYGVPHVIARLYNSRREDAYMKLGLDYVCGTALVAEEIFSKIMVGRGSHLDSFGDFEIMRFSINLEHVSNRQIRVGELERNHGVRIVCFIRAKDGDSSIPSKDSILYDGDSVVACIRHDLLQSFGKFIKK
ncbi:potassium channel family protein [Slackia heliotrinireducens]|jgi:trk system potassium uptake protein TrkA|uniref:Trk system potassium uptake protein TrkA n=1 Tax=Slackia heliotrinireducens (strain ATCC 29202 / DSM 20476 / NCTC 11029 / RHS 1) TaxID=471855 RepID=C7N0M5_SLAHD|nr:TrkA family potassium uptake protein [Slackia heliotrinireducens]ACV21103.1 K+ transport system, NAD-binding component [Slackia heliotrinireducens DSM 20476]VEH03604.1 Trk system potassium uptake protein trkA [Slackia heliotrinireducens]